MTVFVVTHKPDIKLDLPAGYQPILVGAYNKQNPQHFLSDDRGDNISELNPSFCELTALYSIWKHSNDDKVGLVHYRRFFSHYQNFSGLYWSALFKGTPKPADLKVLDSLLSNHDWILATPQIGGTGSLAEQFNHFHHAKDLQLTRKVIAKRHSDSLAAFDQVMNNNSQASFYNMFYTNKTELDQYCDWLFDILFHVQKEVDMTGYDTYQQRLYGFLAERLLNVWVYYRQAKVAHLTVYNTERMRRSDAARLIRDEVFKKGK